MRLHGNKSKVIGSDPCAVLVAKFTSKWKVNMLYTTYVSMVTSNVANVTCVKSETMESTLEFSGPDATCSTTVITAVSVDLVGY